MKYLLLLFFCSSFFYSCQFEEVQKYKKETIKIGVDTLQIEKVKIETH